ncbi:GAA [Symbiodinium natans]|uniref:glucan 1,4-alpha-glucosidase n=1 Tax=Symbiodinium natans TaxID=878477 RepID=A0A812JGV0_9DINO|nr:GAA [Symbiodinium natans]
MGTLQAFKIADLLMELPVWSRIAPHLPNKEMKRRSRAKTMRTQVLKTKEADGRLAEIEKEHEAALEESRTPGQRPFPPSGPQLKLYSRWRRHDYAIEFVKSVADLILTIDTKNGLKVCQAEDSRILFRLLLPEFSCLTPYLAPPEPAQEANLEQGEEQVHFQRPEALGASSLLVLPAWASEGCTEIAPTDRVDCQKMDEGSCTAAGCCWSPVDPNPENLPWCFFSDKKVQTCKIGADPKAPFSDAELEEVLKYFEANLDAEGTGEVMASPDHATGPGGDYYFAWARDGALSMNAYLQSKGSLKDMEAKMDAWISWLERSQNQPDPNNINILVEPKYLIPEGTPFTGGWCRPQNDGPGLRAITAMAYAGLKPAIRDRVWALVKQNLDWVAGNYESETCDLWEEVRSPDFFWNRYTMRKALMQGAAFAKSVGDEGRASNYSAAASTLSSKLSSHIDSSGYVFESSNRRKDTAVIEAFNVGDMDDGVFAPLSKEVAATLSELSSLFCRSYAINQDAASKGMPGVLFGRYEGDSYDGGNPWVLLTASAATLLYRQAAAAAHSQPSAEAKKLLTDLLGREPTPQNLLGAGDALLLLMKKYLTNGMHMNEQIDRNSGELKSAKDLTWNYSNILKAMKARKAVAESDPSQLLGVTLGNSRGALETVEFPWSSPDVEVFSSQASHGGPVLQVDYLLPIEIFVSVGKDDTVRFWSSALHLLREVFFPQPCSTVAFLRLPDMDSSAGHGDVLVGFAAHVERVPMEVWARGVKHEKLGTHPLDSTMRSSQGSKASGFTKSTTLEEDELLLQELYTFSPEDEDVLGERPPSTEIVKVVDEEVAPRKRRTGAVMDFRGAPVMPLGILGGLAADMVGVEERLAHRPEALEHVPHEHSQVLDQGDFRAITRYHAGYYDWTVNPSAMVDAPRGCAIRGVTGDGNVAIVTSVGVGHLRGEGHSFERPAEAQEANRDELPAQASLEEIGEDPSGELLDEAQMAQGSPSPRPPTSASAATSASVTGATTIRRLDTRQQLRTESRTSARTGEVRGPIEECVEETDDEGAVIEEEEEVEDTWRNLRIARGVPHRADVPKPQTQNIANTDADAAKMLRERGKLIDAPEGIETNFLSRITNKKTEWIYCGVDNVQVARRTARKMVHQTIDEGEGLKLWTATGRLRTGHRAPPQRALPKCYVPLPPEHLWERPPMTRSEVTERRIIEAARSPQSGHWMQELALESAEFGQVQRPLIASARVRPRGGQSSRSPSSVTVTSAAETDTSSSVGRPGLPRKVSFNLPQVPKTQR